MKVPVYEGTTIEACLSNYGVLNDASFTVVDRKTFPKDQMVLIDAGAMDNFVYDALDSIRLGDHLRHKPLVFLAEPGVPLYFRGINAFFEEYMSGSVTKDPATFATALTTALCPKQLTTDWDDVLAHATPPSTVPEFFYTVKLSDFAGLPSNIGLHIAGCSACMKCAEDAAYKRAYELLSERERRAKGDKHGFQDFYRDFRDSPLLRGLGLSNLEGLGRGPIFTFVRGSHQRQPDRDAAANS